MADSFCSESEFRLSSSAQHLVPFSSGFATDVQLGWDIYGEGPIRVLVLAGATQSRESNIPIVQSLLQQNDYTVLLIDHPGAPNHAGHAKLHTWSTRNIAKLLILAIQEIGWYAGPAIHICATSLGGLAAMHIGLEVPRIVASLTLVSVYARYQQPCMRGSRRKILSLVTAPWTKECYAKAEMRLLYSRSYLELPDPAGVFATQREALERETLNRLNTAMQGFYGFLGQNWACRWHHLSRAQQERLGQQVSQILLVTGAKDIIVSPNCGKKLAKRLNCPVHVFERCGHSPQRQEPDVFHALLKAHIERAELSHHAVRFSLSA
ncbi:Alpha/Beta hydrolase protein [Protomyces lactucae-debilis]|uniref:Alpha/Beta hydrolase protein n=1 Tax=Protomyces lactucae-debilis TaxID=2754530 RepID=A0A1Y2FRV5_PROLT|nr:Alpha/Beta hydrolase protein [Protomyces lactucae-debilis]ORY86317.1 Alpha/Beta hydrolase protein [Protomyces lactucae-debilis]